MEDPPAQEAKVKLSRHTQQTTATQEKISSFLFPEHHIGQIADRFVEFCRDSMQSHRGSLVFTLPTFGPDFGSTQFDGADAAILEVNRADTGRIKLLDAVQTNRPVAAVDTSTIKLGELENGILCAIRGAIVLLEDRDYRYLRYGPFVFFLGYDRFAAAKTLETLGFPPLAGEPNIDGLLKRIRNMLERWLQFNVSASMTNAFILIDGSLTAGTPDNPSRELEGILNAARRSGSSTIAISKKTKLRIKNESLTNLLQNEMNPCLLDVDEEIIEQFPPYPVRFLGRVFVAKLAKFGLPFRIDIDREIPPDAAIDEFSQLAGTDIVDQGYPETLRMAHVLSTFTATDVLAMQAFAEVQFGLRMSPKLALRHSLFGPFGTSWEALH